MRSLALFLIIISAGAFAGNPAPNTPPQIVSASPAFWAVGVNPTAQRSVTLQFDQQMIPAFTAWLGRSSIAPEIDLNSSMTQDRTSFSTGIKLQPGKVYVLGLNEKNIPGVGFQNDRGISAPPYFLVFQTAGNPRAEDMPPALVRANPPNGASDVNPARVTGISLVFDRSMKIDRHGLQLFEGNTPVNLTGARFAWGPDGKTFTLSYQFKPMQSYRVQLNDMHNIGFASANRIPMWPVQFAFKTIQPQ
jgi:hypothetical protein